jgi:phosphate-selective porin OprO and OprP
MAFRRLCTGFVVAGFIVCFGAAPTAVLAQAPTPESKLEARIAEMEKRIKELESAKAPEQKSALEGPNFLLPPVVSESKDDELKPLGTGSISPVSAQFPGGDSTTGPPFSGQSSTSFVGLDSVFVIRSTDNEHALWITGQIQADYHDYPRHGDTTDIDEFLLRRARLGIEANLFDHYEFRFLPDFGNGKVVIQDSFMNVHYWDEFQFTAGKFKEPVSYEELVFDRFVPTLERSLIDQLTPARDVGMMVHGENLLNDQLDYAIGIFNGEINGDLDTNKLHDVAARIAWRPLNYSLLPEYLRLFQIGVSGTAGKEQEALSLTGVDNETLRTPGGVPWLTFAKNAYADGIRTRVVPEVSYFYDQFGCMAEYLRMDQQIQSGSPQAVTTKTIVKTGTKSKTVTMTQIVNDTPEDVRFDGFMLTATYLLTGEKRTAYSELTRPLRPYDPAHPFANPGAWELVARVSHLQVAPSIFQSGAAYQLASPNGNSDAATELTVGFNWYLNSLVRMQFNWEHAWYQQPVLLGPPSHYFRESDAALVRFQIIF